MAATMPMIRRFALVRLLAPALIGFATVAQDASHGGRLHVLELQGTPYERGFAHGTQLKAEIAELFASWRKDLAGASGVDADTCVQRLLAATHYDDAVRRWTPALLDEVHGLAAGAGQPFATMFAYQLVDEVWAQLPLLFAHKCSTIGLDRDGDRPALVAQNLDLPTWMHAHPTVLRIREPDGELEQLVVTVPGLIGANGMNSRRVAVGVNTVLQLQPCTDGLPVAFVVRGLLSRRDHAAALHFLQSARHASGQAYTIGGPDRALCFEASAGGVVPFVPFAGAQRAFHTNHPVASRDWADRFASRATAAGVQPEALLRCARFDELQRRLGDDADAVGIDTVIAVLSSRAPAPICNQMTYACTVMLLGDEPELRIAPGPPDSTAFATLRFGAATSSGRGGHDGSR